MLTSELKSDEKRGELALSLLGADQEARDSILDILRSEESKAEDKLWFRETVRWPIIECLMSNNRTHEIKLSNGLRFVIGMDSRIEKAILLNPEKNLDCLWEPQTTKILLWLSRGANNVLVGGAYIGDHAILIADQLRNEKKGVVHCFEPSHQSRSRLQENRDINELKNIELIDLALWDSSAATLELSGHMALAAIKSDGECHEASHSCHTVTIDDYASSARLESVELIVLDIEGSEERALKGGDSVLKRFKPSIMFEVHRDYVDWSEGLEKTPLISSLKDLGYHVYAIRDYHDSLSTRDLPVEIIPANKVFLEGPNHGFNMLATTNPESLINEFDIRIVENLSPKLIVGRDSQLHQPLHN